MTAFVQPSTAPAHHESGSRVRQVAILRHHRGADVIETFVSETGWRPAATLSVAGALLYTRYDYLKRLMMRMISRSRGGETDTSRGWEYTDWEELRATSS